MKFPLDVNNLILLFAFLSIVLIITSELINPKYNDLNFVLSRNRIRHMGSYTFYFFIFLVVIRLYQIFLTL